MSAGARTPAARAARASRAGRAPRRQRARRRLRWLALLLALGCQAPRPMVPDVFLAEREPESARERHLRGPRTIQRETRDPKSDQLLRSWKEWFEPGQTPRRDGDERLFYRDGSRKAERHWNKGLPIGVWQSWFPDGTLESEVVFAGPETEAAMRWFHPSGALAAEGMGIQGVRSGPWTYWYEDGQKRQEGCYVGGLKEGEWVLWREDGREEARGSYLADRRVGDWTRAGR